MPGIKLTQSDSIFGFAAYVVQAGYFVAKDGDTRKPAEIAAAMALDFCTANSLGKPTRDYSKRVLIPVGTSTGDKSDAAPIFQEPGFQGD